VITNNAPSHVVVDWGEAETDVARMAESWEGESLDAQGVTLRQALPAPI
jgi:hypothetical protein